MKYQNSDVSVNSCLAAKVQFTWIRLLAVVVRHGSALP